jgi:HSP20 family protein
MNTPTNLSKRNESAPERVQERLTVTPFVDVYENADGLYLFADMPGVTKDAVKINVENGQLTIEAERREQTAAPGTPLAAESRPVDYYRVFAVPDEIDAAKIDAQLTGGVLRLHLPKSDRVKPRRIAVRAG